MNPWFALRTRSRHERIVSSELSLRRIDAFLPTAPRWSRWKDRRKRIDWPLFPGYCFARFDPRTPLSVLSCPGVAGIVSCLGAPVVVPDHEIDALERLVTSELQFDPCPFIKEASMVRVMGGPLKGVVGRLESKSSGSHLILSVDLLGRSVRVQVNAWDVAAM